MSMLKRTRKVVKRLLSNFYYGIKYILFYNKRKQWKEYLKGMVDRVERLSSYDPPDDIGVVKRGHLEIDEVQMQKIILSNINKRDLFDIRIGVPFDDVIEKAETDLDIKFTKKEKADIFKVTNVHDFNNTTRAKIIEIFEKKKKRKKSKV